MRERIAKLIAAATGLLVVAGVLLFGVLQQRTMSGVGEQLDPQAWAALYPRHYEATMRTAENYGRTDHGGSEPYDKLAANPFRRRAWAGYPFELEYNAARGHYHAQADQRESRRTLEVRQPAGCINCHAAEAPRLIETYGWLGLHRMDYDDVKDDVHFGTSCADCHEPATMALRLTRPAFVDALRRGGVDPSAATRAEMRSYVCAQCHVEYYFRGADRELVLPWGQDRRAEDIERYFDDAQYSDWTHTESGAPLIKIQHPEFELYSTGIHAALGVACADCHMPYVQEGGLRISDHWIRSPLTQIDNACLGCHRISESRLRARTVDVQNRTVELLGNAEAAIGELIDAIVAAQAAGAADAALEDARRAHRRAQLRWDFVDAENSTGFHSSLEAARLLTDAVDFARDGQRGAEQAVARP
jgi:nitrite reductase (cytochrome c-552)